MNKKNFNKRFLGLATTALLILSGLATENIAGTSVKTFDFGVGGDNPTFRSHSRSFPIPQNVAVAIRINYRTNGENAIPIIVEVEDPRNQILSLREITAEKSIKRLTINIPVSENKAHGCEKGWQVRIKSKNGQIPPARVFGDITLSFVDLPASRISVEGLANALKKGEQISRNIGSVETFRHSGIINIKASWTHNPLMQALPLKFDLIRPDGSVAKSLVGYGTNSNARPKLDFDYRIVIADTKQNGIWRLRIINSTEQEILEINPSVSFTKRCFE